MATWTDGPEYAPLARPAAFVEPVVAALDSPPPPASVPEGVPGLEPSFAAPEQPTPDLRALVPSAAPGRNPNLPFESATTPLTSVVEELAPRSPLDPFNTSGAPTPSYPPPQPSQLPVQVNPGPLPMSMAPQWAPPPPGARAQGPQPVSFGQIWQATTGWVLVPLLIGMFVNPIAPVALLVAGVSTAQVRHRRTAIRRAYQIAGVAVALVALFAVTIDETTDLWGSLAVLSQIACWILAIVTPAIVGAALRNHEHPERP